MPQLNPIHYSLLKRRCVVPNGLSRTDIPTETRMFIESKCLDIYSRMVNSGASLQKTLTAIYLSGMSAAKEVIE